MNTQVDGRDQVVGLSTYGLILFSFLLYVSYMFYVPISERSAPPQSASFLDDNNALEFRTFPTLVSALFVVRMAST